MKQKNPSKRRDPVVVFKILLAAILIFLNVGTNTSIAGEYGQISLKIKRAPLSRVLNQIKDLPNVNMLFHVETIKDIECGEFYFDNATVEEVLSQILKGTGLEFQKVDDVFLIKKSSTIQQDRKKAIFRGKVVDSKNQPLPGATVMIKGTNIGVIADFDGKFSLSFSEIDDPIVVFSFMGMETKQVRIKSIKNEEIQRGERDYIVTLVDEIASLDDVVVTGYANVRKESYTGNAIRVSGEEIKQVASRNVISVLQVFDPSFRIMEDNAMGSNPNAIPEFYIRGQSGIANLDLEDVSEVKLKTNPNLPIFIMDGLTVSVEKVYDMDPNRVHSITILKDAAATAVYGSRASNGVVVIETVAPKAGALNISYNLSGNITMPDLSSYDYFDAKEKIEVEKLAGFYDKNYNELARKEMALAEGVNTDWLALPLRIGYNQKHSVAIDGGSDNIRYSANLLYDNQQGVMKKDYRNRMGTELRLDYRLDNLVIINRVSYYNTKSQNSPYGNFSNYVKQLPYNKLYDEFGNYLRVFPKWHSSVEEEVNPMYNVRGGSNQKL